MNSNPALGFLGLWMMLQLALTLVILLGGIYALFCLSRAASGLDRMASALEEWVAHQNASSTPTLPNSPGEMSFSQRTNAASQASNLPMSTPVAVQAQPFTPPSTPEYSRPDETVSS